jgi:steroid delta-isomerase-like uncharacterized protein
MDIIDLHFAAENAADIPSVLATYTDDVVWEDTTLPFGPLHGKRGAALAYNNMLSNLADVHLQSVWRVRADAHVIDESIVTGTVVGTFAGVPGHGVSVRFRLLHIFELRDGLISRETAWYDTGSIARQVLTHQHSQDASWQAVSSA